MAILKAIKDINIEIPCKEKEYVSIKLLYGTANYYNVNKVVIYRIKNKGAETIHISIYDKNGKECSDYRFDVDMSTVDCIVDEEHNFLKITIK